METLYFTWEEGPAVLDPVGDEDFGYFISPGNSDWTLAEPSQVADFFVDGSKMSKTDFENFCKDFYLADYQKIVVLLFV